MPKGLNIFWDIDREKGADEVWIRKLYCRKDFKDTCDSSVFRVSSWFFKTVKAGINAPKRQVPNEEASQI